MSTTTPEVDVNDVQGDVLLGLPKRSEAFIFFVITNAVEFKKRLKLIIPLITTTAQVQEHQKNIADHKAKSLPGLLTLAGVNVAFSFAGLDVLGVTGSIGDASFESGQKASAEALGDTGVTSATGFDPNWLPQFKSTIHGLFLVTGDCPTTVEITSAAITGILIGTVNVVLNVPGNVRPGDQKGHEHFGFLDGVSLPAIASLTPPKPGQLVVPASDLLIGDVSGAPWAKNGAFLVYRQFNQLVPEFNKFLLDNAITSTGLNQQDGADLLGARFFGRWRSGAPVDLSPNHDDPVLAADPQRNNNFDFSTFKDQTNCPFAAHVRKNNPRSDLPAGATAPHAINRTSIPFGPEVTPQEKSSNTTSETRGLAFVCYSASILKGFEFLQKTWVNNVNFPPKSPSVPGFDPIIGQQNNQPRPMIGTDPKNQSATLTLPIEFVVSKGGEYFFSPSITALKGPFST